VERWASRLGALLALIGGAVGLGNFLRFPFQAAKWGGGAFLVPYFVALVFVALPLVWMEMALGRASQRTASLPHLLQDLAPQKGRLIGLLGLYVSLGIASYYAYLTGWTLGYSVHALLGTFRGRSLDQTVTFHSVFLRQEGWVFYLVVWLILGLVLRKGLQKGLEALSRYAIPLLFLLAVGIAVGTLLLGHTGRCDTCSVGVGLAYLYKPRWEALAQPAVWLAATAQVFFSVGVGFGMYPVYAAHAGRLNAYREGLLTVLANTVAEVGLGGLIVIPLTTAFLGLEATQARASFGMGFEVMPYVLDAWGGRLLVLAWYALLFLAAFTSLIAMAWVGLVWLAEELGGPPARWTWPLMGALALLGLPTVVGFSEGTLDLYDYWMSNLFLLLSALGFWYIFRLRPLWQVLEEESAFRMPLFLRRILLITPPAFLGALLVGSFFQPAQADWVGAFRSLIHTGRWPFSPDALPVWLGAKLFASPVNGVGFLLLLACGMSLLLLSRRART